MCTFKTRVLQSRLGTHLIFLSAALNNMVFLFFQFHDAEYSIFAIELKRHTFSHSSAFDIEGWDASEVDVAGSGEGVWGNHVV